MSITILAIIQSILLCNSARRKAAVAVVPSFFKRAYGPKDIK